MSTVTLDLPDQLAEALRAEAAARGEGMEPLATRMLEHAVAAAQANRALEERAARADPARVRAILARIGDAPPVRGNER
jgi:hypothetical protein